MQKYQPTPWSLRIGRCIRSRWFFEGPQGGWWDAYVAGNKSRQLFKHAKQLDPSFIDADFGLGDGCHTGVRFSPGTSWFLKMFPDRRAEDCHRQGGRGERTVYEGDGRHKPRDDVHGGEGLSEGRQDRLVREKYPENIVLRRFLGKVYVAMRKYDDAIAQFSEMGKIDPRIIKYKYFMGATMLISGDDKMSVEGERELRAFIAAEKSKYWRASAHYWLGRMYERKNEKEKALAEYRVAHALPEDRRRIEEGARPRRRDVGSILACRITCLDGYSFPRAFFNFIEYRHYVSPSSPVPPLFPWGCVR